MNAIRRIAIGAVLVSLTVCTRLAIAQTTTPVNVQDSFTGNSTTLTWAPFSHACLTAGNNTGSVPACTTVTDKSGSGALRLTDAANDESGAIISTQPFSSDQGIKVTFTTFTYGGDSGGSGKDGADGIGFYLLNGADAANVIAASQNPSNSGGTNLWNLGAFGGSLGYSCSNDNSPHGGMTDAYIGLGMDEFGNYLNAGDNTDSGALNAANAASGAGTVSGQTGLTGGSGIDFQPGRIGLRGFGNINLLSLTQRMKSLGVSVTPTDANVQTVCENGGNFTYDTGQFTTSFTYTTRSNNGTTTPYSGTLFNESNNKFKAAGTTSASSDGYTGPSGSQPFGELSPNNFSPVTITNVQTPVTAVTTFPDYAAISGAYKNLPSTTPIANEAAKQRVAIPPSVSATPITYQLQVTEDGLLSLSYSYNGGNFIPVLTNQSIQASNGTMPASFLFGFGASTGGDNNVHEITCFAATPASLSSSSAGINVQETQQVGNGTQIYLAFFHTNNWWGELEAVNLVTSSTTGVAFGSTNWDASCVLTGGPCAATGNTNNVAAEPVLSSSTVPGRNLVTWDGVDDAGAIPFVWSRLGTIEAGWLNNDGEGQDRVSYLSGDRSKEVTTGGVGEFRARTSVLGDIIDSSPVWVGPPSTDYPNTWQDMINPKASIPENQSGAETYSTFASSSGAGVGGRTNMVYEGANDGFMHGFRAGVPDANGDGGFTDNDGFELIGYMPQAILQTIHSSTDPTVDYSSTQYAHNYFVDATPGTGDLFYNSAWHTWLVSGLGAGGNAIFALDITNPTSPGSLGSSNVIGEWSNSSNSPLTCTDDTAASLCRNNLGQTYGTPQIRRLHNGQWGIIFGNGLNSATGHAGIFVMTIDSGSGDISGVYFLDTGTGNPAGPNNSAGPDGIAFVTPADLDGDHITDYVYAGDAYGNVWRFDLTSSTPTNWAVSNYGNAVPTPLFSTSNGSISPTDTQPITTQVLALAVASATGTTSQLFVEFGTGALQPQTNTSNVVYAAGQQALYGIWDWDLGVAGTPGATYLGLPVGAKTTPSAANPITLSQLQVQTGTPIASSSGSSAETVLTVTNNVPCFVGTTCPDGSPGLQFGWYLNLSGSQNVTSIGGTNQTEQVVFNPIESEGAFIVDTTIPSNNSPITCSSIDNEGFTIALNPATGGAFAESFFINPVSGTFSLASNGQAIAGIGLGATGSASIVSVSNGSGGSNFFAVGQTTQSNGFHQQVNPQNTAIGHRLTWAELH
jgi:type IV pilus assembly protein PilY1